MSSCCTDTVSSQLVGRGSAGSNCVVPMPGMPKLLLRDAPISLNCTLPFASKIVPLRSKSVHARESVWLPPGFTDDARPSACCPRNLPTDIFSAVLPVPKRSYDAPKRTAQSFQHGTHETGAMLVRPACAAAVMNRPAVSDSVGVDALK